MAAQRRKAGLGAGETPSRTAKVVPIRPGMVLSGADAGRLARDRRLGDALAGVARGETRALEQLYRETVGRVYGIAIRIVRAHEAAEEVAEDVYVQVWRTASRFDPARGSPIAWLLTIARSRALDYLRRDEPAFPHPDPQSLAGPDEAGGGGNPQDLLLACEAQGEVARALARLDPRARQLLALAFFRGLSHQEIALHAGLPLGTVKTHIRRALATLRETLAAADRSRAP